MKNYLLYSFWCLFLWIFNSNAQVGINTTSPLSTLDINGNLSVKHIKIIGNGNDSTIETINNGVYISIDPQINDERFDIPDPTTVPGRVYFIRNVHNTNTARLHTSGGQFFKARVTMGGSSDLYLYESSVDPTNQRTVWLISDGLNWTVMH